MWKQRLIQVLWILAGTGTLALLVAAMQKKSAKACSNIQVEITGAPEHFFVSEEDIREILKNSGNVIGLSIGSIDLRNMEETLEKDPWIRKAELFFDNKQLLQVRITEREPVARVFAEDGASFYLDSSGKVLPLSEKLSARVPVFTGFPAAGKSAGLLGQVIALSNYIVADSFWKAQLAQVDITGEGFDMVPVIGNHIIRFGDTSNMEKKFKKLFSFYKNVSTKVGFDKYETINLVYDGQIVATRRGAVAPITDPVSAVQQLQQSLESVPQAMRDTVQVNAMANGGRSNPAQLRQPKAVMRRQ